MIENTEKIVFCRMGRMEYEPAWRLQQQLQKRLIDNKRSADPKPLPHVALLVEHPPVFTLGKKR